MTPTRRALSWGAPALVVIGLVALTAAGLLEARPGSSSIALPSVAPSTLPPAELFSPEAHTDVGFRYEPPPVGDEPKITAEEAIKLADPDGAPAQSIQPILALLPAGGTIKTDTLVWVVRYSGVCVRLRGPANLTPTPAVQQCGRQLDVVVDAISGRVIVSFTDS